MTDMRPLVCPILVGRDDLLQLADRRLDATRHGRGGLLFLAGEAGIGKSRLVGAIETRAGAAGMVVAAGHAYPGDDEVAGGVLLDLARALRRASRLEEAGSAVRARLEHDDPGGEGRGDLHRRRRILVLDVVDMLADLPARAGRPAVLVLEDLHWADDLSLEVVGMLAGRLPALPLMLVATFRSDELYPSVPLRQWRTRLLAARTAEEARIGRLTRDGTATMVGVLLASGMPVARDLAEAVHERSDGVPLHVEELVALLRSGLEAGERLPLADPSGTLVPETLEDAVLRRASQLSPRARRAADAAAVIGRSFDTGLLAAVLDRDPARLAPELAELERAFFVTRTRDEAQLDFRHALIRDALHRQLAIPARRRLHSRVADATAGDPRFGPAFRSIHLEDAGRHEEAFEEALAGARLAARLSAHREARDLLERAVRTAPVGLPAARWAEVTTALADEAAATDDNVAADRWYTEAATRWREAGRPAAAASVAARHVAVRHLLGDPLDVRVARLEAALAELDAAEGPGGPDDGPGPGANAAARTRLLAELAAANMLDRRLEAAITVGEQGRRLALAAGDLPAELDVASTVGASLVFAGRMDEGWAMLEGAVDHARAAQLEAQAARAYRMLGSCASVLVEYERGERWLRDGIAYAEQVELWNHRHYMAAHLGHVLWAIGAWDDAAAVAGHALADGRGGITTRITALHVLGYVALGRGDLDGAQATLEEARGLGERMNELQRLSPALWGLAETARLRGDHVAAASWCQRGADASDAVRDAAYLFPFLVTGTRSLLALGDPGGAEAWVDRVSAALDGRGIPGTLPSIAHARGLVALGRGSTGRARDLLADAASGWETRGRAWEGTWATLDMAGLHARANRVPEAARLATAARETAARMGAAPIVAEADDLLRRLRSRAPVDAGWAPLTAREMEVARLIATGSTNAEIAAELGVSPRTVTAHVEHILAKLGATRRAEVAAWVVRVTGAE